MSVRRVTPNITTSRMAESLEFYTDFVGFRVSMDRPIGTGRIVTLVSPDNETAQISLLADPAPAAPSPLVTLIIQVADADGLHDNAVTNAIPIVYPLTTEPWGVRRFHVLDPNGVVVNLMAHLP